MIKRPLLWILGAYLAGMYLAWLKISIVILILIILFYFLVIYLLMFHIKKKIYNRRDGFLWCMPFLLLLGFLAWSEQTKKPELQEAFDRKVDCELSGSITMIVEKKSGIALYLKNNEVVLPGDKRYLCENVIVYYAKDQFATMNQNNNQINSKSNFQIKSQNNFQSKDYLVGNKITVQGTLQKFSAATNPGQFNEQQYYQIENIDFKMQAEDITVTDAGYSRFHAILGEIRHKLVEVYDTLLSNQEAGALIAMLLGEKYLLGDEIKQLYQQNGISHVLAISGLHVSLIGMFVFGILKRLKFPISLAIFLSIFVIYCYGVLTNFSVSTNRAVVMMIVLLMSTLFGKTYDMLSAMALSAFIILLQNPLQILSVGFLLSFGAVFGIAVLLPCFQQMFPSKNSLVNSLFISASAQVSTTPFILYFFYQFPTYSIITNLIVLPFVAILTLTGILAGVAGVIYLPLGVFLIGGANYILKFYEWICRAGSSLPCNLITVGKPELLRMLIYITLSILFVGTAKCFHKKICLLIPIAAIVILLIPQRNVGLEVTFLDVGQGDAIYMESERGTTYLVDGGSSDIKKVGTYRLKPFLLAEGTDQLDYAIMTHSDEDHISGLKELMEQEQIEIKNLILPYIITKDNAYVELEKLAIRKKIKIFYIRAGDILQDEDIRMTCLHPSSDYVASSANAYSTVLSINYGKFDMLLTGDLQQEGEKLVTELLQNKEFWVENVNRPAVDYDILKVAHHGSKSSTFEDFLSLIRPEISIISCGRDNFYGHPHRELLERLSRIGSEARITYKTGAITIKTDGEKMEIHEYTKD